MAYQVLRTFGGQLILACFLFWTASAQTPAANPSFELNYLEPANYRIEEIQVTGIKELEKEALLATLAIQAGDVVQLPGPTMDELIKKIWQQKLVKDVNLFVTKTSPQSIILTIAITECPRLSSYTLEGKGMSKREKRKLEEEISLEKGKVVTNQLVKKTQRRLQEKFIKDGYLNAQVEVTSWPDPDLPGYMQFKIKIDKGEKLIVNKILIAGNQQISDQVLKAQLGHIKEKARFTLVRDILKKTFTLQPFKKGGILWRQPNLEETFVYLRNHIIFFSSKFTKEEFEEDKKQLINYYQSKGYRDVRIIADSVYQSGRGLLNIALKIDEGEQYRFGKISWVGNYIYDQDTLSQVLNIKPGSIYNPSLLQERLWVNPSGRDVASLYMDHGYLFFRAEPVEVKVENNQVDIEIRIQEDTKATINQVNIQGNTWTHDHVIRRELKTLPGDEFSKAKLQRSHRELVMLDIFDPAAINIIPVPNLANHTADLNYTVKERPKFDFRVAGGWGGGAASKLNFSVIFGGNNLSFKNLFRRKLPLGDAQMLNFKADFYGWKHQDFSLQFIEPWLGGKKPTALSFVINKSFQQLEEESSLGAFGIKSGLSTRLKWPDDYFILRLGTNYTIYNYKRCFLVVKEGRWNGRMHEISFNTAIERISINDPIYPTEGSEVGLHVKFTPPYSLLFPQKDYDTLPPPQKYKWKEFHQWILDASYFQNLFGDWVLNFRAHGGIMGGYNPQRGTGPFERFSMGGNGLMGSSLLGRELISLRGYPEEHILPRDHQRGYHGGTIFDKWVIELRHPIVKSSMIYIYALAFAEAGNTWLDYQSWWKKPWALYKSTGLGFRIHSPVGVIGFEWGYGYDRKVADKLEFNWSFGTGGR